MLRNRHRPATAPPSSHLPPSSYFESTPGLALFSPNHSTKHIPKSVYIRRAYETGALRHSGSGSGSEYYVNPISKAPFLISDGPINGVDQHQGRVRKGTGALRAVKELSTSLHHSGPFSVFKFCDACEKADESRSGKLSFIEFRRVLGQVGVHVSPQTVQCLYNSFGGMGGHDGIVYGDLLHFLSGELKGSRRDMAASVYTRFTTGPDGFISRDDVLRSISHSSSQELPGIIATHLPPRISLPTFQTFLSALTSSPTASDPSFHSSLSAIWPLISPSRNPTPSTKPHPNLSSLRGLAYGFPSSHSHPPPKKPPANTKLEFKRYGVLHDYSVNAIGVPVDYTPPVPKRIGVLERDTGAVVDVETLRNTIKTLLVSKTSTPAPLLRSFRQSDPHSSGTLPISTFTSLLSTHLPLLGRQNVEAAVKHYATSGSTIPYETFISDLVGPKDPLRSFMSDQAFQKLDIHKKGYITLSDLQSAYNPSTDSGYRNGTRTKPQSFQSLIQNGFDGSERMDRITLRDFRRFWGYRGCTVLDDRVFGGLVFETFDGRGRRSM